MRSKILRGLGVTVVSLMFSVPAYAYSETTNGGNGGLGNGMGTSTRGMHAQSNDGAISTKGMPNYDVSVYGTGTGSQFFNVNPNANVIPNANVNLNANVNPNANVTDMTDRNPAYRTQSYTNDGYRALNTNRSRGMGWGWLGLLGLLGLFGLRSRDPERGR